MLSCLKWFLLLLFAIHFNGKNFVEAGCCGCCCGCCRCCCCPQPPIIIQPPPALHKVCHVPCCCCKPCCCCCKPCCCCCGCGGGRKKRSVTYRTELLRRRRQISDFVHCQLITNNDLTEKKTLNDALFPLLTFANNTATTNTINGTSTNSKTTTTPLIARARRLTPAAFNSKLSSDYNTIMNNSTINEAMRQSC